MQPPQNQPPNQPPAWTQYDPQNTATPVHASFQPQTTWDRQMAVYRADIVKWAQRLNIPIPALWALIVVLVICSCSFWGFAGVNALTSPSPSQAAATQTARVPPTSLGPTATPFPTFTPGPSPTPIPIATATPNYVIFRVSGNGNKSTDSFTVHGKWRLSWVCSGGGSVLAISIMDASTNNYANGLGGTDYSCPPGGGGDNSTYHQGGTLFFSIIADVDYTITVTDLPG